jgi:hypothetical protein
LESTPRPRGRLQPPAGPSETPDRLIYSKRSPPTTRTTVTRSGLLQTLSGTVKARARSTSPALVSPGPGGAGPPANSSGLVEFVWICVKVERGGGAVARALHRPRRHPTPTDQCTPKHEERLTLPPCWVAVFSKQPFRNERGKGAAVLARCSTLPPRGRLELFLDAVAVNTRGYLFVPVYTHSSVQGTRPPWTTRRGQWS